MDDIPIEAFLAGYPPPMAAIAERLRSIVREAVPESIERVRAGWRLIGYDIPSGRRTVFFAFVAPEPGHVHLGFERGVLLDDPDRLLTGAGMTKQVRWVTYRPGDPIDVPVLARFVRETASIALLGRDERLARLHDRELRGQGSAATP